jgi:hypothetical protein
VKAVRFARVEAGCIELPPGFAAGCAGICTQDAAAAG